MIPFNKTTLVGNEQKYVLQAMSSSKISGDGYFGLKCQAWFEEKLNCKKALLTPSCTHSLEMAAILIDIQPGDEVIMPSYTFVSTANPFVLRGARIIFVDVHPDTMNIDASLIEVAITSRTKAIVPVHYAGVGCDMDSIMKIATQYNLIVIEDAAQGLMSNYKGKALGTIGHMGTYSYHETKNYTSGGEGGLLLINDDSFVERAEIIREKGTNRSQFFRGMVDKYSWVDVGSSYLPSELQAAYLMAQLEKVEEIKQDRLKTWNAYYQAFYFLKQSSKVLLPVIPKNCEHNAHMFCLILKDIEQRTDFIQRLQRKNVTTVFHYVPLHTSLAGERFGCFSGEDVFTTAVSEQVVRLPLWYGMSVDVREEVISAVIEYFK